MLARSPYSPLFTSGLLSDSFGGPSTLPLPNPFIDYPRRGSLPTDTPPTILSGASQKIQSPIDTSSAFYFTLQPQRDSNEFRSFLSLDLAESQSLRSVSTLRNKPSHLSKCTSYSKPARKSSQLLCVAPPPTLSPARRASRESLRSIPSPKPVPSAHLPDLPTISDQPPRLPSILLSPALPTFSVHAPSRSSSARLRTPSIRSSSISSTHRHASRSNALARLEGRSPSLLAPSRLPPRNFMSMSDDEDDEPTPPTPVSDPELDPELDLHQDREATSIHTPVPVLALEEDEDVVLPRTVSLAPESVKGSTVESLAVTIPIILPQQPSPKRRHSRRTRKRRSTMESWFPLASFIDFRDDDLSSWNWRSFIEVASAA